MRRDSRAITSADEGGLAPLPPAPPGLEELVAAVRAAVSRPADWQGRAELVSQELARHLPSSDVLGPELRIGDPDGHRSHLLYSEPGGTFSIVALVWRPGQVTPIHDHVTWCVFGVVQGEEREELICSTRSEAASSRRGRGRTGRET